MVPDYSHLLAKARILVVEDDPLTAAMLHRLISPHVAMVKLAHNGSDGLDKWREMQPDVTMTDVSMPDMDGLAMSEAIKERDPDAVVIVISSSTATEDLRRAIDIGVDRYVFKPVDKKLLLDALTKGLRDRERALDLQMARMVFEVANEGILVTDSEPRIIAVNPAFSVITGYRPDEVIGQKTNVLSSGLHDADFYRSMWNTLETHGRWSGEITNRRKNGEPFAEWLSIAAVEGKFQGVQRYVGLISDISERKKEEELIRRLAHFDSLTGLPNRVLFNDRLQRAITRAKRHEQQVAALYIDLDHFKQVNDTYGHTIGDEVLKTAATRMLACVRQSDTVGRRGGDEFVIILEQLEHGADSVAIVCTKLIHELNRPVTLDNGIDIPIGASIGIALFPDDADDGETLLSAADFALYEAKAAGRAAFRFFRPETQRTACSRMDMERELRDGLKNWRYALHYLPEVSLITGKVENVEALLRFHHPQFGLLEAGRFLEIAEEIGIMPELGQKALAEAVREIKIFNQSGCHFGLVVDLSAHQLSAPNAVSGLLGTLLRSGFDPTDVTFECAEHMLAGNDTAMQTLFQLAATGCKFTLDDFGAGYCSFSLISQLPMSSIKIDRSFINELEENAQSRELVAALIAFSKRLRLRTVAEGVENPAQLRYLHDFGCDSAQGYVFGRPMTFDQLRNFMADDEWKRLLPAHQA